MNGTVNPTCVPRWGYPNSHASPRPLYQATNKDLCSPVEGVSFSSPRSLWHPLVNHLPNGDSHVKHSMVKVRLDLTSLPYPLAPVLSLSFLVRLTVQAALAPTHFPRLSLEKQQVVASSVAVLALYSSRSGTASAGVLCVCLCTPKTYLASSLGGAPLSEDLGDTLRRQLLVAAERGILRKGPC